MAFESKIIALLRISSTKNSKNGKIVRIEGEKLGTKIPFCFEVLGISPMNLEEIENQWVSENLLFD